MACVLRLALQPQIDGRPRRAGEDGRVITVAAAQIVVSQSSFESVVA